MSHHTGVWWGKKVSHIGVLEQCQIVNYSVLWVDNVENHRDREFHGYGQANFAYNDLVLSSSLFSLFP